MLYVAGARIDEHENASGGAPGDQTGREVCVHGYYNYPWNGVLRYKGPKWKKVRNRMMCACYRLCKYDSVGYSQTQRNSLDEFMRALLYRMNKIRKLPLCNTDCSAMMGVVVSIAMVPLRLASPVPQWIWTGVMRSMLEPIGFEWVTEGIDFETGAGLKPGDLLVNTLNHTVLFMGSKVSGKRYRY